MTKPNQFDDCLSHCTIFSVCREMGNNILLLIFPSNGRITKKYNKTGSGSSTDGTTRPLKVALSYMKTTIGREKNGFSRRVFMVRKIRNGGLILSSTDSRNKRNWLTINYLRQLNIELTDKNMIKRLNCPYNIS